jgi:hypothetical protein
MGGVVDVLEKQLLQLGLGLCLQLNIHATARTRRLPVLRLPLLCCRALLGRQGGGGSSSGVLQRGLGSGRHLVLLQRPQPLLRLKLQRLRSSSGVCGEYMM